MKKAIICILLFAGSGLADKLVNTRGPYIILGRSLTWASTINDTWLIQPINPDQGICIFVANNNPTTAHTFTLAVHQTGDPLVNSYTGNTGRYVADTVQGTYSPVPIGGMTTAYVHTSAAARIAITISGATVETGTPDTGDVYIVQTSSDSCGPVQGGAMSTQGTNPIGDVFSQNPLVIAGTDYAGRVKTPWVVDASSTKALSVEEASYCVSSVEIPTSSTSVFVDDNTTRFLTSFWAFNSSGSAVTIKLWDKSGTPLQLLERAMATKETLIISTPIAGFTGGVFWEASASGVNASLCIK